MESKNLTKYLHQSLGQEVQPKRLEETIKCCTEIMREQKIPKEDVNGKLNPAEFGK